MQKKRYFQKLYKYEPKNETYLIEVSLDDYNDIYDDWDPSPFKKRDIENEFNDFIVNSSEDIPLNLDISIVLYLPLPKKDTNKETVLISAYRNYYNYVLERLHKEKSSLNKKNTYYLTLSLSLLTVGYFFFGKVEHILLNVLHEGVFIGGWVFLWEFFTNTFIGKRDLRNEYKLYKRLLESEIKFIYK